MLSIWTVICLGSNEHRLEGVAWLDLPRLKRAFGESVRKPLKLSGFPFACPLTLPPPGLLYDPNTIQHLQPCLPSLTLSRSKKEIWEHTCSCSTRVQRRKAKRESFTIVINVLGKSTSHQTYVLRLDKLRKTSRKLLILKPNITFFKREPWVRNTAFAHVHVWILFSRCRPKQLVGVRMLRTEWLLLMTRRQASFCWGKKDIVQI